ncbi:hypothetical protein [Listeria ilorinensis]|uniref:hypothetical protein n=1 Tax=Listeria ilorinensis TaxID=2867439 RepID=UPI001EF66A0B|nr:hypothetical protein [Listeria ilorinensis]
MVKGKVILSGYQSDLYDDYLNGWDKKYISANSEAGQRRTEVLWMNFKAPIQLDLFK